ncbi:MAG TPA: serine hydrolase domain-containing protein [Hyphomonadaceae bacterium]|nr:serine hydrolase domain-containing protein [Hyphomonadaceae bacterium]
MAVRQFAIEGSVAKGFEPVRHQFAANFERSEPYRDIGASLAVYRDGKRVVDLWGGWRDSTRTLPWKRNTLVNVYSTTKGVMAAALAMAVDAGKLRYEDKVAKYWPEFAAAGKGEITVAQLISHQGGLPGFIAPTTVADLYDWAGCCAKLAAQAPAWKPGEETSYHAGTYGYLAGEVFRRAVGETVGRFIARRIAAPLGADIYLGLPPSEDNRVAPMIAPSVQPDLAALNLPQAALMALSNPVLDPADANTAAWRRAELPAMNLHGTADGIARVFAALANGGEYRGKRLLSQASIARMCEVQSRRRDLLLGFEIEWAMGLALNTSGALGPNRRTFGHTGWGGSFCFADPDRHIGAAYTLNRMGADLIGDPRGAELAHVIAECA